MALLDLQGLPVDANGPAGVSAMSMQGCLPSVVSINVCYYSGLSMVLCYP